MTEIQVWVSIFLVAALLTWLIFLLKGVIASKAELRENIVVLLHNVYDTIEEWFEDDEDEEDEDLLAAMEEVDLDDFDSITAKSISRVTIFDPETNQPIELEVLKLETGSIVGIDAAWIKQDIGETYSPYDQDTLLTINEPDSEPEVKTTDNPGTVSISGAMGS